jgi:hypothetical protein
LRVDALPKELAPALAKALTCKSGKIDLGQKWLRFTKIENTKGRCVMKKFHVNFYKEILSSDGHPFRCLQGSFDVMARTPDRAGVAAKRRLERSSRVSTWKFRADSLELEETH